MPSHRAGDQVEPPAGPPPGWYLDPGGLQVLRWWDGRQWGPQTQPLPGLRQESRSPYADAPAPGRGGYDAFPGQQGGTGRHRQSGGPQDDTANAPGRTPVPPPSSFPAARPPSAPAPWAWAVACSPLLLLGVAALVAVLAAPNAGVSQCLLIGAAVADAFAIFAASKDARALRAAGEPVGSGLAWWCLLVPWAYLWARAVKRTNKTNTDWGLLAAAVAVWLLAIVVSVPVIGSATTTGETFNRAQAQTDIAKGIKAQSGVTVTVNCPQDPPLNPGSKFECIATAGNGSTTLVTVTIQDRNGDVIWQTGG